MSTLAHVVCPHDGAINRLPAERLADEPRCGKCRHPLFDGHPLELTTATMPRHVGHSDVPLLVDFWAPWCGPCRVMAPSFEKAAPLLEPRVRLAKVNTEAEPALAGQYAIRSIPTLVMFSGGREVARQSGALAGAQQIVLWAEDAVRRS